VKKKVLLHTCCAPCTTQVHVNLVCAGYAAAGFFYNPNIFPEKEYYERKSAMERYCSIVELPMIYIENDLDHKSGNCNFCYKMRLEKTAHFAKSRGFDCFTTTLLISPYQKHDLIKSIGNDIAKVVGIDFLYLDFRPDYYKGRDLARMYNLYRQKHCGCSVSIKTKGGKNESPA